MKLPIYESQYPDDVEMDSNQMFEELKKLRDRIDFLMQKRITQVDIVPDSIKTRAMGEANRFLYSGLEADRPTGDSFGNSTTVYFATDTNKLYVWNGNAWKSSTLT